MNLKCLGMLCLSFIVAPNLLFSQVDVPDQQSLERLFRKLENAFEVASPLDDSFLKMPKAKDKVTMRISKTGACALLDIYPIVNQTDLFRSPYFFERAPYAENEDTAALQFFKRGKEFFFGAGVRYQSGATPVTGSPDRFTLEFYGPAEVNSAGDLEQKAIVYKRDCSNCRKLVDQTITAVLRQGEFDGQPAFIYSGDFEIRVVRERLEDKKMKKEDQRLIRKSKLMCHYPLETAVDDIPDHLSYPLIRDIED